MTTAAKTPPSVIVIFGAAGDLTGRKLVPALYHLASQELLANEFAMIGIDRADMDSQAYRDYLSASAEDHIGKHFSDELWQSKIPRAYYMQGDFLDDKTYTDLKKKLLKIDKEQNTPGNYLFYLATPPRFFGEIAQRLKSSGLAEEENGLWRRLIVEKPFGNDLQSAQELNRNLHQSFQEHQIYRIDHYLGKETVQNIMTYRFGNGTVEPIWNHHYIDHVQITVAESLGVENRASYYDHAGAMRDMVPNHLLALLSIIAMEPPNSFNADAIRDEQTKVLKCIQPFSPEMVLTHAVRGQYDEGQNEQGDRMPAYRDEPDIADGSNTETYVALKLMIDTWRWAGVPFYLRTGKRLPKRCTEVVIQYRHAPNMMFRDALVKRNNVAPNRLVIRIQPNEGISLQFNAKVPGTLPRLSTVNMEFNYSDYFGDKPSTGYETLIYDCMCGDATLFKRADNIEAGWELVQPILDVWSALPARTFPNYAAGSWGPQKADDLLAKAGHQWSTHP